MLACIALVLCGVVPLSHVPRSMFSPDDLHRVLARTVQQSSDPQAPPSPSGPSMSGPYAALFVANGLDTIATYRALTTGAGREAYPFLSGNPNINALQKAGTTAAEIFLVYKLAHTGHPMAARVLGYALAAAAGLAGTHNLTVR